MHSVLKNTLRTHRERTRDQVCEISTIAAQDSRGTPKTQSLAIFEGYLNNRSKDNYIERSTFGRRLIRYVEVFMAKGQ